MLLSYVLRDNLSDTQKTRLLYLDDLTFDSSGKLMFTIIFFI